MTNQDPQKILAAKFHTKEKRRQATRRQVDDLALLKAIKHNATRLWHHHQQTKNIIKLED